ncbi:MAG TPA: TetR/AcrR family transcriptional regulator [Steroidobacteraceae bacterium]|nr:TetR/AcrR family transcriptional regulator [Steroidobacteraceae bacterium]
MKQADRPLNAVEGRTTRPEEGGTQAASPWPARRITQRNRDLKREAVLRTAARAFNARGYHNTSIDEIAAALNVTKPTIYYYVANKEQLLLECILTGLERVVEPFRRPRDRQLCAREQLNRTIRHYAQAIASEYGWCMVRAEDLGLSPESLAPIKALKSEIDQGMRRLLDEGIRDGSIETNDPKMTAFALAGALNWIAHWYRENQSMTPAEIAEAFVRFFNQGLAPRADAPRTRRSAARFRKSSKP